MISIVIPLFNEEQTIPQLQRRLLAAAPSWQESFEVILVDDGSTDGSRGLLRAIVADDERFRVVQLSRNFGHQAAISAGLRHSRGDVVVIMDGDLQDPPEELPRFLEQWRQGYDVVYAIRTKRKERRLKRLAYFLFYRFLSLISEIDIPLDSGDFCVMDRKVVRAINELMPEQIRFVRGLRAFAGFRQIGITCERGERASGEAKYSMTKLFRLALDGLFGFSLMPLRAAALLGVLIALPSFVIGLYFIVHRVFGFAVLGAYATDTPGLASLAVGMFFLGGVMLIIMGVLGEYIGRIYMEVKRRPTYIVEQVLEAPAAADRNDQLAASAGDPAQGSGITGRPESSSSTAG